MPIVIPDRDRESTQRDTALDSRLRGNDSV